MSKLTAPQINLWLAIAVFGAVLTGLVSWAVGTEWSRLWTALHGVFGVMILVLTPAKTRGSVSKGMKRGRATRWVSALFGVLVLATIALGFLHATGLWTGVGYWASLWTHFLLAFLAIPLLLWHILARPVRPRLVDLDRRMLLRGGAAAGFAGVVVGSTEVAARVFATRAADRRFTGSYEVGSRDPAAMPTVSWINDTAPTTREEDWVLTIAGETTGLESLREAARPLDAALDCTGGWWSLQKWDVVPLSALVTTTARSLEVTSATGYGVRFPTKDLDNVYLAVGYEGQPLRRGHGAPVRIVAPGRRGPWWVKWVTDIKTSDRPWWLQSPFPLS